MVPATRRGAANDDPENDAVRVTGVGWVAAPLAVAVNAADVAFGAMTTELGTDSIGLFEESRMVAPEGVACERATVQVVLPVEESVVAAQANELSAGGTERVTVVL